MRVVWSSMALFVLSSAANAQAALTGYVRDDESLRGLQGVELSVTPGDKHVRTDKEGKYTLKDLTPGANRVQVRFPGFAPLDTILTLASDKPTDGVFFLGKHAVALDTVTSRGARTAGAGFESFEIRRSKGFGRFMDSLYLRSHENVQLPNLLRDLGGVQIATASSRPDISRNMSAGAAKHGRPRPGSPLVVPIATSSKRGSAAMDGACWSRAILP